MSFASIMRKMRVCNYEVPQLVTLGRCALFCLVSRFDPRPFSTSNPAHPVFPTRRYEVTPCEAHRSGGRSQGRNPGLSSVAPSGRPFRPSLTPLADIMAASTNSSVSGWHRVHYSLAARLERRFEPRGFSLVDSRVYVRHPCVGHRCVL